MANYRGVSNMQITAEIMQTYDLLIFAKHNLTTLFSPYKTIPSALHNKSEATKRSRNQKENGNCTNATNRRSRVGLSTPFYAITICKLPKI